MKNKLLLIILGMSYNLHSNAGVMPIPIIVPSGGGPISQKELLSLVIAINIICFSIIILRSLIWVFVKPNFTYTEYVWFSPFFDLYTPTINLMVLLMVNGITLIFVLANYILKLL